MATAFNFYQPLQQSQPSAAALREAEALRGDARVTQETVNERLRALRDPLGRYNASDMGQVRALQNEALQARNRAAGAVGGSGGSDEVARARDQAFGMTAGVSDRIMNDEMVGAALAQLQRGMQSGPYSAAVQQQLVNRNADQTAAAEAVNAEEIRNAAAARGIDPTQALRQAQQNRQAQNVAFQGDMGSRAALANYDAQQNAARALASTRLGQYGQAQPGYMQAAQMAAQTQYTGGRQPAAQGGPAQMPRVTSGGQTRQATPTFTPPAPTPAPTPSQTTAPAQRSGSSVADRNKAQAEWAARTNNGMTVYGKTHAPGQGGLGYARDAQSGALQYPNGVPAARPARPSVATSPRTTVGGPSRLAFEF